MSTFSKILSIIPRVACLSLLPLALIFDLVTGFKHKETAEMWDYITNFE